MTLNQRGHVVKKYYLYGNRAHEKRSKQLAKSFGETIVVPINEIKSDPLYKTLIVFVLILIGIVSINAMIDDEINDDLKYRLNKIENQLTVIQANTDVWIDDK